MGDKAVLLVLIVTAAPFISVILGATLAATVKFGQVTTSAIQHLAAGLVIAAVSIDLVPDMIQGSDFMPVIIGFGLGVSLMFALEWVLDKIEGDQEGSSGSTTSLLATVALDLIVDGFLIGVGFSANVTTGILLSIALTLEILFLGLSCATALRSSGTSSRRTILIVAGLGLCMVCSAVLGAWFLSGLSGGWLVAVASFGVAALLYLVTEELLVRAHSVPDTKRATVMFFAGFLLIIVIDMMIRPPFDESELSKNNGPAPHNQIEARD